MVFNKCKSVFVSFFLMLIFCSFVLSGCKKSPVSSEPVIPSNPNVQRVEPDTLPLPGSLSDVVSCAKGWGIILNELYGERVADFKFDDIDGASHRLSDYDGKKIMIVLWATWCLPCRQEVPHLIALRNIMSEDELAIIAISAGEGEAVVRKLAGEMDMNYTVVSMQSYPPPFNRLRGYPTSFFINPDGTIKVITEGTLLLGDMKSILLSE